MALISAKTIITSVSLFHITLGFFFLTNPSTVDNQALVYVLGESMGMPYARGFESPSQPLAFLSAVLALLGVSDLVSLSMPEEIGMLYYWGTQAPLRTLFSMLLVFYTFFFGPSSPIYTPTSPRGRLAAPSAANPASGYRPSGWGGDALKNRVFFAFMFVEMVSWFWIWITLREERNDLIDKARRKGLVDRDD